MNERTEGEFTVQAKWNEVEDSPIHFTNQMLVQHVDNEFIIAFGYMTPPVFLTTPTPEEVAEIDHVPIKTIVRLGMTPDRLLELIKVLQKNYRGYQEQLARRQGIESDGES